MALTAGGAARENSASATGKTYRYPIAQMKWNSAGQRTLTGSVPAKNSPAASSPQASANTAQPTPILARSSGSSERCACRRQNQMTTGASASTVSESSDWNQVTGISNPNK